MKINEYGFNAVINYRKAEFTGSVKRRVWTSTVIGKEDFCAETEFRRFLKTISLAEMVSVKIDMAFHGHHSTSMHYDNIFLKPTRHGKPGTKYDGVSQGIVAAEIEHNIDKLKREAKNPVILKPRLRGLSRYSAGYDDYAVWSHERSYFAIPVALKKNRTKFKKAGPKPDAQASYYKKYKSWS